MNFAVDLVAGPNVQILQSNRRHYKKRLFVFQWVLIMAVPDILEAPLVLLIFQDFITGTTSAKFYLMCRCAIKRGNYRLYCYCVITNYRTSGNNVYHFIFAIHRKGVPTATSKKVGVSIWISNKCDFSKCSLNAHSIKAVFCSALKSHLILNKHCQTHCTVIPRKPTP